MKSTIRIVIPTEQTNLDESLRLLVNGDKWDVLIKGATITIVSIKEYAVPGTKWSEKDMDIDGEITRMINRVAGHVRNATYFAYGLFMKWGIDAYYGTTKSINSLDLFPSIHQGTTSIKFESTTLPIRKQIFEDIGSVTSSNVVTMLNYWRRAHELDDLGFNSEAYLNYYKVLECLQGINENPVKRKEFLNKFMPVKEVDGKKARVPMTKIRRHLGRKPTNGQIEAQINKAATMFASAKFIEVSTDFTMYVIDLINLRDDFNVAHNLLIHNKNDSYFGVGQHSDSFSYVTRYLHDISALSKQMILNYAFPGKYMYDWNNRSWTLRE